MLAVEAAVVAAGAGAAATSVVVVPVSVEAEPLSGVPVVLLVLSLVLAVVGLAASGDSAVLVSAASCAEATVLVSSAVEESAMAGVGIIDATSVRATALESRGERRQSFLVTIESARMCCGS